MNGTDAVLATAIAALLVGAGVFAVAETSLTRMTPTRAAGLVAEGRPGARSLQKLVTHPDRFLNTVLLLALGCQLVAATLVGLLADRHLSAGGVAVATTVEVLVTFVLAEAAPKSWAVAHGDRAALLAAPVAGLLARTAPLRVLSSGLMHLANALLPGRGSSGGPLVSEAELLATTDAAAAGKAIEAREREIIHSVLAFGDTAARDVMVPRGKMVTVDAGGAIPDTLRVVISSGLSRLPAIDADPDHIAGLLYAKDLLAAIAAGRRDGPVRSLLRPVPTVPDAKPVTELLREMQAGRYHMVILTDARGRTAGLVTIEDLIEEIIGEIEDEYDAGSLHPVTRLCRRRWLGPTTLFSAVIRRHDGAMTDTRTAWADVGDRLSALCLKLKLHAEEELTDDDVREASGIDRLRAVIEQTAEAMGDAYEDEAVRSDAKEWPERSSARSTPPSPKSATDSARHADGRADEGFGERGPTDHISPPSR